MRVVKNLAQAYIILFVGCFMLYIYEPIIMYATNMDDFWFDFQLMIVPTIEIFSALFLMAIVAITTIYIQGNWLVNDLPPLDGTIINWMEYGKGENKIYIAMLIAIGGGGIYYV